MTVKEKSVLVFKYGGNAMTDPDVKEGVVKALLGLKAHGHKVVVVHGGGPFIKKALAAAAVTSEFVDGQRRTSPEAMKVVEETLKGQVNSELVGLFNKHGGRSVGLSGKDGQTATAKKRVHLSQVNGKEVEVDLGRVGDVALVDPTLLNLLLANDYLPVVTCIAADINGDSYNINGDNFAGIIAGALKADQFIVLTDVDGLMRDINRPDSLIEKTSQAETQVLKAEGIIAGGMIPKTDACLAAMDAGARSARIINGTKPDRIEKLFNGSETGTLIEK